MSAILAIAEREIQERKALLYVVLACSLGNLALLLAPGLAVGEPSLLDIASATLGVALPAGLALGVGASVIGRDLAERRLSFYFSRPFSGFAIWAGKTLGGLIPVLLATLLCTGSVIFVNDDISRWFWLRAIVLTVIVFLLAQVGSALYRSRPAFLIFDVLALAVVAAALLHPGRALHRFGADEAITLAVPAGLLVLIASLLAAGWLLIAKGRGDASRGHVASSSMLWSVLALGALAFAGYTHWVLAAPPSMEGGTRWRFALAPHGDVFFLGPGYWGGRAGFRPSFWVDARSGRHESALLASRGSWPLFSNDGERAYWTTLHDDGTADLAQRNWSTGTPVERRVALGDAQYCAPVALSPSENRLLLDCNSVSRVVETKTGRTVAETKGARWQSRAFVAEDQVRGCDNDELKPNQPWALTCRDWQPSSGRLTEGESIAGAPRVIDQWGERLLLVDDGSDRAFVVTGPVGALTVLRILGAGPGSAFLSDGSVLAVRGEGGKVSLTHLGPDGSRVSHAAVELGVPCAAFIAETKAGQVALRLSRCDHEDDFVNYSRGSTGVGDAGVAFVDLSSGRVASLEKDLRAFDAGDSSTREFGGLATRMFIDEAGRLIVRDPETGSRRVLIDAPAQ